MFLVIAQIINAIILMMLILLQAKGTGLGSSLGGSQQQYHSKKGVEKIVFIGTIVSAVVFVMLSIVNLRL